MSKQQATISKQRSTLSKQHSTLLPKTATTSNEFIDFTIKSNVASTLLTFLAAMSNEDVKFVSTLSKEGNFVRHCCQKTVTMSKQHST